MGIYVKTKHDIPFRLGLKMKLAFFFIAAAVATQTHPHKKLRDSNQTEVHAATTLKRSQSEAGRWWCPVVSSNQEQRVPASHK